MDQSQIMENSNQTKVTNSQDKELATRRIHMALDKGIEPKMRDVEVLGGVEALKTLKQSRLEMKEEVQQIVNQERAYQQISPILISPETKHTHSEEDGKDKVKKPSQREQDYYVFVHDRLGPLLVFFIYLIVRSWDIASFYALSPTECEQLAEPLSKIGPKLEDLFHTPKWVHTVVTTSEETVTILYVMASYLDRVGLLGKIVPEMKRPEANNEPTGNTNKVQERSSNGNSKEPVDIAKLPGLFSGWSAE